MDLKSLVMYYLLPVCCVENWFCAAGVRQHTSSFDIAALKSVQKAFITSMFTTVKGLCCQRTRRKWERCRWVEKQEVDQQDEALPFPNRLFPLHLAITSVSISLSAFWLIRSNTVCVWRVFACVLMLLPRQQSSPITPLTAHKQLATFHTPTFI